MVNLKSNKKQVERDDNLVVLQCGTLRCPHCGNSMHFEQMYGMRVIKDDLLSAYCPVDKTYFYVNAVKEKRIYKRK